MFINPIFKTGSKLLASNYTNSITIDLMYFKHFILDSFYRDTQIDVLI